jgi:hypothetical protein
LEVNKMPISEITSVKRDKKGNTGVTGKFKKRDK